MKIANNVNYGLTAGFYGSLKEADCSSRTSKRAQPTPIAHKAATTGAWPGFQPLAAGKVPAQAARTAADILCSTLYARTDPHAHPNMLLPQWRHPEEESCSEKSCTQKSSEESDQEGCNESRSEEKSKLPRKLLAVNKLKALPE